MVAQTSAAIEECRTRKMPPVVCWNERVFNYRSDEEVATDGLAEHMTLTDEFLWSLHAPLKKHPKTSILPSWFYPPAQRPGKFARNAVSGISHD